MYMQMEIIGGPLFDSSGNLTGMNPAIHSPSGASSGVCSIPVDTGLQATKRDPYRRLLLGDIITSVMGKRSLLEVTCTESLTNVKSVTRLLWRCCVAFIKRKFL